MTEPPLVDPDCRHNKHDICPGGDCECWCHTGGVTDSSMGLVL